MDGSGDEDWSTRMSFIPLDKRTAKSLACSVCFLFAGLAVGSVHAIAASPGHKPVIKTLSPEFASTGGGTLIRAKGLRLGAVKVVKVGAKKASKVRSKNRRLTFVMPSVKRGLRIVRALSPRGKSRVTVRTRIKVVTQPAPPVPLVFGKVQIPPQGCRPFPGLPPVQKLNSQSEL
jgi:hypothetical protein